MYDDVCIYHIESSWVLYPPITYAPYTLPYTLPFTITPINPLYHEELGAVVYFVLASDACSVHDSVTCTLPLDYFVHCVSLE